MEISLFSFGFKHGHPQADFIWDVRFLPNPFWVPELKDHTGQWPPVAAHALDNETGRRFLDMLEPLLLFMLDQFRSRDRQTVTLAVGCTGGRHRSVAVVERLAGLLEVHGFAVAVSHRDIGKV